MRLNPFPRGGVRPERYLYGRSEQLDAIERLAQGVLDRQCSDVLCFLAPAGLGKTCLLKLARRTFQQKGWLCGYSEASSDATTSILDLLSDAGEALPQEGIGAKFRARIQEFNVSAGPVGVGVKLGESPRPGRVEHGGHRSGALYLDISGNGVFDFRSESR